MIHVVTFIAYVDFYDDIRLWFIDIWSSKIINFFFIASSLKFNFFPHYYLGKSTPITIFNFNPNGKDWTLSKRLEGVDSLLET